jgi:hypothetical protein
MEQNLTTVERARSVHEGALTPFLPPALLRAIESGVRPIILPTERGGGIVLKERLDWNPPKIGPESIQAAHSACDALLDHLESIDEARIPLIIGRLKAHNWRYSRRVGSESVETILDIDWIEDLRDFPEWAINHACREWRRTQEEAPIIAGIRRLCEEAVADDRRSLRLLRRLINAQQQREAA